MNEGPQDGRRRKGLVALGLLVGLALMTLLWTSLTVRPSRWQYTSAPYQLSRLFDSMDGPFESKHGVELSRQPNELLWLTAFETTVTDESAKMRLGQEFVCHSSLFLDSSLEEYRRLLGTRPYGSRHIFSLAQGQSRIEFPKGYAIPLPSSQQLEYRGQPLNSLAENIGKQIRHQVKAEFVEDSTLWFRPKPLFQIQAAGGVLISAGHETEQAARGLLLKDKKGNSWSGHWIVPPGEQINRTDVTKNLALPFDTRAHYITSHLHPYAVWQELRDKTSDEVIYRVEPVSSPDGRTLVQMTPYSSAEGVALFADHQYELATCYNNTSQEPVTAMSIAFLYCDDLEFQGFDPSRQPTKAEPSAPAASDLEEFCGVQPHFPPSRALGTEKKNPEP